MAVGFDRTRWSHFLTSHEVAATVLTGYQDLVDQALRNEPERPSRSGQQDLLFVPLCHSLWPLRKPSFLYAKSSGNSLFRSGSSSVKSEPSQFLQVIIYRSTFVIRDKPQSRKALSRDSSSHARSAQPVALTPKLFVIHTIAK